MSMPDPDVIADRLTRDRLGSYLATTGDVAGALGLYDWNSAISGAFYEDIGRLEVVLRNAIDEALVALGTDRGWATTWYDRRTLFPGNHGRRAMEDIAKAQRRAAVGRGVPAHGKVIAELTFGFWRYLCSSAYLTSLWVPAVAAAFPNHPSPSDPRAVRHDVEDRVQRVHFLRNRIAHHEPVHRRSLQNDHDDLIEVVSWICSDTAEWVVEASRVAAVLAARP